MKNIIDIKTNKELIEIAKMYEKYNQRFLIKDLNDYINASLVGGESKYFGKVCCLFGLRRTGKTTMMYQAILDMNEKQQRKTAFINVTKRNSMIDVYNELKQLKRNGYQYVFIDEITKAEDFIDVSGLLSDIYVTSGMHIVITGTDSLGIYISKKEELFDRTVMLHTTYIPFYEYQHLFPNSHVDDYIENGGLLSKSGSNYNEDLDVHEYVDEAIAQNIQHSLKYVNDRATWGSLMEFYANNELTGLINRVIEDKNHLFSLHLIYNDFISNDMRTLFKLLLKKISENNLFDYLTNVDRIFIDNTIKDKLEIHSVNQFKSKIDSNVITQVETYLYKLDVIDYIDTLIVQKEITTQNNPVIVQPAIRFNQAKIDVETLYKENEFNQLIQEKQNHIIDKLMTEIKGRMLEEIILLDTTRAYRGNKKFKVYKMCFHEYKNSPFANGEFDMVIQDPKGNLSLFEIKHSSEVQYDSQTKHLNDSKKLKYLESRGFTIKNKFVLYNGQTKEKDENDIQYVNVGDYLKSLGKFDHRTIDFKEKENTKENPIYVVDAKEETSYIVEVKEENKKMEYNTSKKHQHDEVE